MRIWGFALLLVAFAAAAEEPEAVYGRFHRALASGNLEETMRYAPAARRAELASMSPAQKEAQVKMMSVMLPKGFTLMNKRVAPDGRSARLIVTGPAESLAGDGRMQTMYGTAKMVLESGEWKVDELSWSSDRPGAADLMPASAKPASKPAAAPAAAAPAAPARKLGAAKPECVYKPVMTNEDMERCR